MSSPLKFRLSPVVESTLRRLREERSLGAPDASALEGLSSLPEETAVDILNGIAAGRVTNLSAAIILSVKMHRGTGRTSGSASPVGSPVTPTEQKKFYKDGGKEEKKKNKYSSVKCFFVRTESRAAIDQAEDYILSNKSITEARAMFMHVHTLEHLSKYMARFSLTLSKTIELPVDLRAVNVEFIDDIPCLDDNNVAVFDDNGKPLIHTDGTGFISEDLALRCPKEVVNGLFGKEKNMLCKRRKCDAEDPVSRFSISSVL
ncbi:putative RNA-dependent RNA polymerase 4 [Nymphaea thermarum]|nr:putative RNA-dependent RNA polymerase 4 [Nymphaea thermarum]